MKAIIDGLRYDTDTAEEIAVHSNGLGPSDFHYLLETLYRTPNGRWFVHGEGGARTRYACPAGDGRTRGRDIRPLRREEAMEWLEAHGKVKALEHHFADEIEEA